MNVIRSTLDDRIRFESFKLTEEIREF